MSGPSPRKSAPPPSSMVDRLAEFTRAADQLRAEMYRAAVEVDRLDSGPLDVAGRARLILALRRLAALGDELDAHASRHREILKPG